MRREESSGDLACDIAVEYTIDRMDKPCTRRILGWVRQNIYKRLEEQKGGISAAVIYRFLDGIEEEERITLEREFYTDDHCYWPKKRGQSGKTADRKPAEETLAEDREGKPDALTKARR